MLNFGHTFGHALETISKYNIKLNHGEAISIGMALALKISLNLKNIKKYEYDKFINHIKKVGLPFYDKRIYSNIVFKLILSDKKNANNKINLVLIRKIGEAYFKRNMTTKQIKELIN